jgi:hypothetical protein
MVLCNLLDGGLSHSGPVLGLSKPMRGAIPGTNPRQQPLNAWQVSRC